MPRHIRKLRTTALDASEEAIEQFWNYVRPQPSGCSEWMGSRNHKGYGIARMDGVGRAAHRVAYELKRGPIASGLMVCHTCDNPPCCNSDHLFLGTASENIADRMRKGRTRRPTVANYITPVCAEGHPLEGGNVITDQFGRFAGCFACYKRSMGRVA